MCAFHAALCSRWDNNGKKFIAVTRGYQPPLSRDAAIGPRLFVLVFSAQRVLVCEGSNVGAALMIFFFWTFGAMFDLFHLSCVAIQIIAAKSNNLLGDVWLSHSVNHRTF